MSPDRGIGVIFSDLLGEVSGLVRNEIRLAKAEFTQTVRRMLLGLVLAVVGIFVLILAVVFLLEAAAGGLMLLGLNFALSTLLVGIGALLAGGLLMWLGIGRLKIGRLSKSRTAEQLKKDAAVVGVRAA
ncbi:MAG TPA: phage holin family protein [Rhizomicrobium sp.]